MDTTLEKRREAYRKVLKTWGIDEECAEAYSPGQDACQNLANPTMGRICLITAVGDEYNYTYIHETLKDAMSDAARRAASDNYRECPVAMVDLDECRSLWPDWQSLRWIR